MVLPPGATRRDLLSLIGVAGGAAMLTFAMTALGHAEASDYAGPPRLEGDPRGATVLVLGAGVAGMVAALELRQAGYRVQVLEYNGRAGGRTWTLRGGDVYTELGGATQHCGFAEGLYLNPGPWRIPYHHRALLDYCRRLGVALEPFIQVNHNAYLHAAGAFGGKPVRFREIQADFHGGVAELLAKAVGEHKLDDVVTADDAALLLEALRDWGALGPGDTYRAGFQASERRGWAVPPGGGISPDPVVSVPLAPSEVLRSRLWHALAVGLERDYQTTLFQPVGGMDRIARAFERSVGDLIRYHARVTAIRQDERGVRVAFTDTADGSEHQAVADWCVCTIPLSILSQVAMDVGPKLAAAIAAVPYAGGLKIGLQFRRRFWEQDEAIFGGISYTDLPISVIGYPASGFLSDGPGVLLGAYPFGPFATEFTAMAPEDRVRRALADGARIHPQYGAEFQTGIAVGWHRVPWAMGCFGLWTSEARAAHYRDLCEIDGRIVLAGEHASRIPAWQEGAVLSALDAITRLHRRVVA